MGSWHTGSALGPVAVVLSWRSRSLDSLLGWLIVAASCRAEASISRSDLHRVCERLLADQVGRGWDRRSRPVGQAEVGVSGMCLRAGYQAAVAGPVDQAYSLLPTAGMAVAEDRSPGGSLDRG